MKHGADELQEGETMILTLADKNILDDKGDLDDEEQDELENVLAVCHYTLLNVPGPSCQSCHLCLVALEASFMQLPYHQSIRCLSADGLGSDGVCKIRSLLLCMK